MTTTKNISRRKDIDSVTIRSWPKVIFLYPIVITALVCGIYQSVSGSPAESNLSEGMGLLFFIVLALNLLVISFEFSRFKTLAVIFFIVAVLFFLLYLSTRFEVFKFLRDMLDSFHIRISSSFYYALAFYLVIMFGVVFLNTRFNYWVIKSNEILHKEGFLGDVRRFPSPNLKMTKEITDVFEFLLLGSGRVVLYPATEKQAIVLEHVLGVNKAERNIQSLLSALQVEVERYDHHDDDEEEAASPTG